MTITDQATTAQRIAAVEQLATSLIEEHLDGWRFEWDRAVKRAGACHYGQRKITLSRPLAARWESLDDWRDTILHEIAHALTPGAHHGPEWKRQARALGCSASRTHDGEVATEQMRWVGRCPSGHTLYRSRRPKRTHACGRCSRVFDSRFLIEWTANPNYGRW